MAPPVSEFLVRAVCPVEARQLSPSVFPHLLPPHSLGVVLRTRRKLHLPSSEIVMSPSEICLGFTLSQRDAGLSGM